jgi:hypothetical protein
MIIRSRRLPLRICRLQVWMVRALPGDLEERHPIFGLVVTQDQFSQHAG